MRAAQLTATVLACCLLAQATTIYLPLGAIVYFDRTVSGLSGCPQGFVNAPASLLGYVLIGETDSSYVGTTNGVPPMASVTAPTHTHSGGSGLCTVGMPSSSMGPTAACGGGAVSTDWMLGTSKCNTVNAGATSAATSGYPFLQLMACINTADPSVLSSRITVDNGAVVFLNQTIPAGTATSCSTEWAWNPFNSARGRTLVPADPALTTPAQTEDSMTYGWFSDVSPLADGAWESAHNHSMYSTTTMPATAYTSAGSPSASVVPSASPSISVNVAGVLPPTSLNIPLQRALVCVALGQLDPAAPGPSAQLVPEGSMMFFAAQSGCPNGNYWYQVEPYKGRLVTVAPTSLADSGLMFGSSNLLSTASAAGTGPDAHTHTSFTGGEIAKGTTCGTDYVKNAATTPTPTFVVGMSADTAIASNTTGPAVGVDAIPFLALVLCRRAQSSSPTKSPVSAMPSRTPSSSSPSASPTSARPSRSPSSSRPSRAPSAAPTSASPSRSPSKAPSSSKPSASPTRKPSRSPTRAPSHSPSAMPTKTPTTSKPSVSPTSRPSRAPTSSSPTRSPTSRPSRSPTSARPSASPSSARPSVSPTHRPTQSPSKSPASSAPSASPHTAKPTRSPSHAPSHAQPSRAPTFFGQTYAPLSQQPTMGNPQLPNAPTASPKAPVTNGAGAPAGGNAGAIAGGVVGGLLGAAALAALGFVYRDRVKRAGAKLQQGLGDAFTPTQPAVAAEHKRRTIQSFFTTPKYFHGKTGPAPPAPPGLPGPPAPAAAPSGGKVMFDPPALSASAAVPLVRNPMYAALPALKPPGMPSVKAPLEPLQSRNPVYDGPSPPASPLSKV